MATTHRITDAKYVSLVTHRPSGEGVPTPVWIVDLGDDDAGVITDPGSGKVRRVHDDHHVTMTPCDVRGNLEAGAATVSGTARVVADGPRLDAIRSAVADKYGLLARAIDTANRVRRRLGRGSDRVGLVVALDGDPT